jgi:NitT/TauT family transport system permease protein
MKKTSFIDRLLPFISGACIIGIWYLIRMIIPQEQLFLLPAPHEIIQSFVANRETLWAASLNTGRGALFGFSAAVILSFFLALFLSLSPRIRASFYPHLMILQMTPIIILAPILILWVGPGMNSIIIITFLICFFPMVVNTTQGLLSTDANLVDFFRMCNASKRQEIFWLRVPSALPYFFTGLRIAATLAPIGAIVGDLYAGSAAGGEGGLGFLTIVYASRFQMGALFATAIISCMLGFIFVGVVLVTSWWALHKWHDSYSKES